MAQAFLLVSQGKTALKPHCAICASFFGVDACAGVRARVHVQQLQNRWHKWHKWSSWAENPCKCRHQECAIFFLKILKFYIPSLPLSPEIPAKPRMFSPQGPVPYFFHGNGTNGTITPGVAVPVRSPPADNRSPHPTADPAQNQVSRGRRGVRSSWRNWTTLRDSSLAPRRVSLSSRERGACSFPSSATSSLFGPSSYPGRVV